MMEEISSAILGFIQGLTEFLPVSSSGHLVVFQEFLPIQGDHIAFDLVLHIGTLLPILWVYRTDISQLFTGLINNPKGEYARLAMWIVLGSVPTAIIGIGLEDLFEEVFHTPKMVGIAFFITACILFGTKYVTKNDRGLAQMTWKDAVLIGIAQGMAITPGISRSGSTIAAALFLGLRRDLAAKYSFLLSIPAILGGFILKFKDLQESQFDIFPLLIGFICAAFSGYVALRLLLKLVNSGDFSKFSYYLVVVSLLSIVFL
jgi:undecaprenyl-diphosphatase